MSIQLSDDAPLSECSIATSSQVLRNLREASASSAPLTAEASDLSARVPTSAAVLWKPGPSEGRDVLQTSDIAVVVQV